jgi:hypothetical protein
MSYINDYLNDVITEPGEVLDDQGLYSEGIPTETTSDTEDRSIDYTPEEE